MLKNVRYQSPIFVGMLGGKDRDARWKISQQCRRCWVEIVDAGWKQNIANKYCATLNVNSLHINIVRHI